MLKFGILGAGNIAHKFMDAVRNTDGAEVTAVASKSAERAEKWAREENLSLWYGDYDAMLADNQIDAVYIATLVNSHYDDVVRCLRAGKHVICEKPIVQTYEQAKDVIKLSEEKKLFLMEGMWTRFLPKSLKVKEWIESGRIGKLKMMQANIGWKADKIYNKRLFFKEFGGGSLYDLGIYPLELLPYYANEKITQIQILKADYITGVEDLLSINISLESCFANIQCSFTTKLPEDGYLYGSDGYIHIPKIHFGNQAFLYDAEDKLVDTFQEGKENGFCYEVEEVVSCIGKGKIESTVCPHSMILETARIFDEVSAAGSCMTIK